MASMKALIVGGGIAGPALAYWLSLIGIDVTLIERAPQLRASGQQLDVRGQGVPMMKKMGIEPAVRAAAVHEIGTQFVDREGRTKAFFPAAQSGTGKQSFTSEYEIMRGDLVRILCNLTENRPNVRHLFDTTIDSFTQDDDSEPDGKVHVKFKDGREEDFDLVVGADGTSSRTRRIMLGLEAPDPRHPLGGFIAYFSVLSQPEDSNRGTFYHIPDRQLPLLLGSRKDCPELTRIYMLTHKTDPTVDAAYKSGSLTDLKNAFADLYQDGGWECKRFMDALRHAPEADDLYCTPFEEVRLPQGSWSKGRVVLIGDAAHSQTANGYGTTWGMVGAYILAGEIASLYGKDGTSPTTAVIQGAKNYEEKFRPIATATHGGRHVIENLLFPRTNFGLKILHTFARVAAHFQLDQMAGLDSKTSKWQLPDYPALDDIQEKIKA